MRLFRSKLPDWTGTRHDYRQHTLGWGHNLAFKVEGDGKTYKGYMWSPRRVNVGDRINVGATDLDLLLTEVRPTRDPNDMYFFTAKPTPVSPDEPDAAYPREAVR